MVSFLDDNLKTVGVERAMLNDPGTVHRPAKNLEHFHRIRIFAAL